MQIPVIPLHTEERIRNEIRLMLQLPGAPLLTLGMVMKLKLADSPYIIGGHLAEPHTREAMDIIGISGDIPLQEAAAMIKDMIKTSFGVFEIICRSPKANEPGYPPLSPEWMADIMSAACRAIPSLTWHQILWEVPFALIAHLIGSAHRSNGGKTVRPFDVKAALVSIEQSKEYTST